MKYKKILKKNIHPYERVLRTAGGIFFTSLSFWGPKNKWFLSFLVPVITGLTGNSPLYSLLKISTKPKTDPAKTEDVEEQANKYFPVQSSSEIAAGHPIVGSV